MKHLVVFLALCATTFAADYISFYPGKDAPARMRSGVFEGSNSEAILGPYTVIHTIAGIPTVKWNKVVVDLGNYRYLRYRSAPNAYGYVADIQFYRNGVKVAGTPYGTDGSFYPGSGIDNALDGKPNTVWVAPIASGGYVGIDTGLKGTRFGDTVGLNVKYVQGEPWEPDVLIDLGVKWVRDVVGWDTMEPARGIYLDFPQDMKDRLAFYKAHNIGVVFGLWYDNPAYEANTLDAEAYGNYAAHVAKLLTKSGVTFVLEIWNEPRTFFIRPALDGDWVGRPPSAWLDHYVLMTQNAVSKVKAVDPSIKLITDDDLYVTHYWYLEKGLPQEIAGFAIHPYTIKAPEHAAVNYETDWCMPWHFVDIDNTMSSGVRRLKEQGQLKLNKSVEIWSTEQGWWQGDPEWETNAAMWLPRAFIHAASAKVKATCWFSSMDVTDGPMGLRTNEGIPRKSYAAFKTMTKQLGDYVLDHQTEGVLDSYGLQSYTFKGPTGDTKVVVWVADIGAQGVYRIPDTQGVTAVDYMGNPVEVYSEMLIGNAPIYLSGIKTTSIFP